MAKERILVVDDEERIRDMICEYMQMEGYLVDQAANGQEGLNKVTGQTYSLLILDVMMPIMDGWTLCREIRKFSQVPIILLTARGEEYDKLFGFELGVDDYMVKPFSPKELLARIKAILKRLQGTASPSTKMSIEGLSIDFDARNLYIDGELITLTPKEYDLLTFFIKNPNRVFTRDHLLNEIWGYDFFGDARTVDTHVKLLREHLKVYRKFIVTVWGTGYKFETGGKP